MTCSRFGNKPGLAAVSNLIACNNKPTLVAAINSRQQEFDEITRQLLGAEPDSISAEIGRIRQFVTGQLGDIRQLLQVDVQKAKVELAKHVTEIRMMPQIEGKKGRSEERRVGKECRSR